MSSNAQERISGSMVIQAFAQEGNEQTRFQTESEELFSTNMRRILIQSLHQALAGALVGLAPLVIICYGGYRVIYGDITVGELIAITMYLGPLYLPLQRFSELNIVFSNSMAALDRIYEIMDEKPEIVDRAGAIELSKVRGDVTFDSVSFSYNRGCPILKNVTFSVGAGQKVAMVGPSGSGKTTLVNLIPRFYDVGAGRVMIDGHDVRDIKIKSLRRFISMVLQDPVLFSGTIRENILYGNPSAGEQDVIRAARAANAYDFISSLPNGFDTQVGERGALLSGGQKQRITIARAFLKDPAILILDEATSSLDSQSEYLIQDAMARLVKGRTTFVIAHRLSTIIHADQIFVLDAGSVIESGTHEELLDNAGTYKGLYEGQFRAALCASGS
jgi:subfamily B ATP-binding cassette protein MsbA